MKDLRRTSISSLLLSLAGLVVVGVLILFTSFYPTSFETSTGDSSHEYSAVESAQSEIPSDTQYEVTDIVDGDTIKIDYEGEIAGIRLIGIDTPELHHPTKPVECFAQEATDKMDELLEGEKVRISFDATQDREDRYGRLLLYIWRARDGLFINEYMIREGYAHEYTYDVPYMYTDRFIEAEKEAQQKAKGLWGSECSVVDF